MIWGIVIARRFCRTTRLSRPGILWGSYHSRFSTCATSGWMPAYHGTWFYGLWSILHHGIILESSNEGKGLGGWDTLFQHNTHIDTSIDPWPNFLHWEAMSFGNLGSTSHDVSTRHSNTLGHISSLKMAISTAAFSRPCSAMKQNQNITYAEFSTAMYSTWLYKGYSSSSSASSSIMY